MTAGPLIIGLLGASLVGSAAIYWVLSDEHAGALMLLLSGVLGLLVGGYLVLDRRAVATADEQVSADAMYLPHASVWPFWTGLGWTVVANGLAVGVWGLVPGSVLLVIGVTGLIGQSRRRD